MKEYEKVCIVCPIGCRLTITEDPKSDDGYKVEGNNCPRGEKYGIKEVTNPTRVLTTTVKIVGAHLSRIPVISNDGIPKDKLFEAMEIINNLEIIAPIKSGDVVVKNILDTRVDIVASRSMEKE
ncbi:DUF1667 domain-containing protein [Senegalia massiliensis]|uniref:DUF1667 domain-containing protein n=1 Tax=Senegalia massiliensis TaxID=1720316 RepID=A0A845QVN8_9CLOT|nr:DUF1667 domain-containing protein [Senegalia massiliensis]NBI06987.1 DUF1667 domain-containing protein [Senegalia massiliensis]